MHDIFETLRIVIGTIGLILIPIWFVTLLIDLVHIWHSLSDDEES